MSNHTFKTGDIARCIKPDSSGRLIQDKEYKVKSFSFDSVTIDDEHYRNSSWFASRFEPVTQHKFKAGDKVRALDTGAAITKGNTYTVGGRYQADYERSGPHDWVGIVADDEGNPEGWWAYNFELVAEPTIPDRPCIVAILNGNAASPAHRPHVHANRSVADTEAKRLAEQYPGSQFAVYERVGAFVADKPVAKAVA
jgi:hypothetical protein